MRTAYSKPFGKAVLAGLFLSVLFWMGMRGTLLKWACRQAEVVASDNGYYLSIRQPAWQGMASITVDSIRVNTPLWEIEMDSVHTSLGIKKLIGNILYPKYLSIHSITIRRHHGVEAAASKEPATQKSAFTDLLTKFSYLPDRISIGNCAILWKNKAYIALQELIWMNGRFAANWQLFIQNTGSLSDSNFEKNITYGLKKNTGYRNNDQLAGTIEASLSHNLNPTQVSAKCSLNPCQFNHPSVAAYPIQIPPTTLTANGYKKGQVWHWKVEAAIENKKNIASMHLDGNMSPSGEWELKAQMPDSFLSSLLDIDFNGSLLGIQHFTTLQMPALDLSVNGGGTQLRTIAITVFGNQPLLPNDTWRKKIAGLAVGMPQHPFAHPLAPNGPKMDPNPRGKWAKWNPVLIPAILQSEDEQFYQHQGINWDFLFLAANENLKTGSFGRGGGTITMQLVRNLWLNREKNLFRKVDELVLASLLESEQLLTKDQILDFYLQIIEWGPNIYGLKDAARFYFNKPIGELNNDEILLLSYFIPNPKQYAKAFQSNGELTDAAAAYMETMRWMLVEDEKMAESELDRPLPTVDLLKGPAYQQIAP